MRWDWSLFDPRLPAPLRKSIIQACGSDEAKDPSRPETGSPSTRAVDQKDLQTTGSCDNQLNLKGDKDELESSEGKLESIHG